MFACNFFGVVACVPTLDRVVAVRVRFFGAAVRAPDPEPLERLAVKLTVLDLAEPVVRMRAAERTALEE